MSSVNAKSIWPNRANYYNIPEIALSLYFFRDATGGFCRYFLYVLHINFLWFVPDIFAMLCLAIFIHKSVARDGSFVASLVLFIMFFYLIIGYLFLGTVAALGSSFKMILPVFVGFCFYDKHLSDSQYLLKFLKFLMYISIAGIIASKYIPMPWVGFEFEAFGATRSAGTLWWSQNEQRLAGFAADNTMAGYFTMMTFVLTSFRRRLRWCLIVGATALYAIDLTTSKTSLALLFFYLICLCFVRLRPTISQFPTLRAFALASFVAPLIPIVMIIILNGSDLANVSPLLFSLQDRINNSWQLPFQYMLHLLPIGILTGCGIGCFNYPQNLFSELYIYWVPVDNFYIGTYLMFGLPFVAFVMHVISKIRFELDPYKLCIAFVMNIFTITVLSYGPATGLIMMSTVFGCAFARVAPGRESYRGPRLPASVVPARV